MKIEILGPGCPRCRTLEENARKAVEELGLDATVEKVADINEIAARGVLMTPGLVVDGRAVSSGHLLSVNQIKKQLEAH